MFITDFPSLPNPAWVTTIAAILLAAYVLFRSRTPQILQTELKVTRDKCERLERDNHNLIKSSHLKDVEIAELKSKTDLNSVMDSQRQIMGTLERLVTICDHISETQKTIAITLGKFVAKEF